MSGEITLVLGGARSGKSAWAEELATGSGRPVLYVATATMGDDEMTQRIAAHRARRPAGWHTLESQVNVADAVRTTARPGETVLVDCLTLWVSNVILNEIGHEPDADVLPLSEWTAIEAKLLTEIDALIADARERDIVLLLVSNEVGMGLVPPYPLGRHYRDILGRVNQVVARTAEAVVLMIAGLPVDLRQLLDAPHRAIRRPPPFSE